LRRQRTGNQHVGFLGIFQRDHAGDASWSWYRARLIHAEHVIVAASSEALRRVTSTPRFASSADPMAMLTVT